MWTYRESNGDLRRSMRWLKASGTENVLSLIESFVTDKWEVMVVGRLVSVGQLFALSGKLQGSSR